MLAFVHASRSTSYFSGTVPSVLPQPPAHTQTLPPYSSLIGSLSSPAGKSGTSVQRVFLWVKINENMSVCMRVFAARLGQVYVSQEGGPPQMQSPPPLRRASLSLSLDPNQHILNLPTVDSWWGPVEKQIGDWLLWAFHVWCQNQEIVDSQWLMFDANIFFFLPSYQL